ncbi:MAG TPA: hypothetical protein VGO55_02735 [Allosphingosinicella sp.]|jgi:hypothetical protein|nr:hypothetical protein [Allosphingosinicella sp.]
MRLLAMLAAAALPGNAQGPQFSPVAIGEAIAYFRHICVETLPDPSAFAAALAADTSGWTRHEKSTRRVTVLGHFWSSPRGELSYVNLPGVQWPETNPGCHYAFRTGPEFDHDSASRALAAALRIDGGRQTRDRREQQTRWEVVLPSGLRVRIFLSTAERDMGGPAATLSISAYRRQSR